MLLLGGTGEARRLAGALSHRPDISATISFAGRTEIPSDQPIPHRVGGFGGVEGLVDYLRRERIERVLDATHPFASRMQTNAVRGCAVLGIPLARLSRPAWRRGPGDDWVSVANVAEAIAALGDTPRRVFLTIGRTEIATFATAPQHRYLVRSIGAPYAPPSNSRILLDRPPYTVTNEEALMRGEAIEILVSKNSGGEATAAKLVAARRLSIPVVMIERPDIPRGGPEFCELDAVLDWLDRPQPERGV